MSDYKEKLATMVDALINQKPEEANIAFHSYLGDKMKAELHGSQQQEETADDKED